MHTSRFFCDICLRLHFGVSAALVGWFNPRESAKIARVNFQTCKFRPFRRRGRNVLLYFVLFESPRPGAPRTEPAERRREAPWYIFSLLNKYLGHLPTFRDTRSATSGGTAGATVATGTHTEIQFFEIE